MSLENIVQKVKNGIKKAALVGSMTAILASCNPVIGPNPYNSKFTVSPTTVEHYVEEAGSDSSINDVYVENQSTGGQGDEFIRATYDGKSFDLYNGQAAKFDVLEEGIKTLTIDKYVGGELISSETRDVEGLDTIPNPAYMPEPEHNQYWDEINNRYSITSFWGETENYEFRSDRDINNDATIVEYSTLPDNLSITENGFVANFEPSQEGNNYDVFVRFVDNQGESGDWIKYKFFVK